MTANFFLRINVDHLGNVRLTYKDSNGDGSVATSEIIEEKNYYPFGLQHKGYNFIVQGENSAATQFGYNGMEKSSEFGLETLDFGARNYDPAIGRWMNIDPLAESMRRHSPYNYAFNNPVFFIDPDGMRPMAGDFMLQGTDEEDEEDEVIINGSQSTKALNELQSSVEGQLVLARNEETGEISATLAEGVEIEEGSNAEALLNAINDDSITVNIEANNTAMTSERRLMVGGAFMGNTVTENEDGGTANVVANQEVNPYTLANMSNASSLLGADMLHEVTEAYQGAIISQGTGVSSPSSIGDGSVYPQAHRNASPQSGQVTQRYLNENGFILTPIFNRAPSGTTTVEYLLNGRTVQSTRLK